MKEILKYLKILIGCELIALAFDFLILPNNLISFGVDGIGAFIYHINNINPSINILIMNIIILLISSLIVKKKRIDKYILPSMLIPIMMLLTSFVSRNYTFELPEMMLVLIVSGFLTGLGYSMIYNEGYGAGVIYLVEDIIGNLTKKHSRIYSWILDIILLVLTFILYNYQVALYSLVVIVISKYMITKARFGLNTSKMFFVITSQEKEVQEFILYNMKYELTILDVEGGYSHKNRKILMSVINTSDYYALKEAIKVIDPEAFIAITDTYDVINAGY